MVKVLEERSSMEILHRDEAINSLKKEVEILTSKNKRLVLEAANLCLARKEVDEAKSRVVTLEKYITGSKAAEQLALERALKANNMAEGLRKEIDAEKASSASLVTQIELLNKRFDDPKAAGLEAAKVYIDTLGQFGGVTPPVPDDSSAFDLFAWMKRNFAKLPDFVGEVGDFAALSSTTNLSKTLQKAGCDHIKGLEKEKAFASPAELGDRSAGLPKAVKNFIRGFWVKFGHQDAKNLAEAHRAEVCGFQLKCFSLLLVSFSLCFQLCSTCVSGFEEGGGATCSARGSYPAAYWSYSSRVFTHGGGSAVGDGGSGSW